MNKEMSTTPYRKLGIMSLLSFVAMFVLMYAMVDSWSNVYPNLNQFYMAALMTAAMVLIELVVMQAMYPNGKLNLILIVSSTAALVLFFLFIQKQTAISDRQFLQSMIPHHAAAILMCKQAPIQDQDIQQLCGTIITTQQAEIDWMQNKLQENMHETP
jgi:uncharacterized protein (DUF305 family)